MNNELRNVLYKTVMKMIEDSESDNNINKMLSKHEEKIHFIPIQYRVLGGILQSLNIKFGNFIEELMRNIVEIDENLFVMEDSGKKITLFFTHETDALIDTYITNRQLPNSVEDCTEEFENLLSQILEIEKNSPKEKRQGIKKDIDGLYLTSDGLMVYTEIKYNDDHDTGKFADINRKFIKTWAGLAVRLNISNKNELFPIIYYFNDKKRYNPIHTPSKNIMRGPQFFDKFLQTEYEDVNNFLAEIGNDPQILKIFDDLYRKVRHQ